MKIINREQFLALPPGTVFAKYKPCVFEELEIKGNSLINDYIYQQIAGAIDAKDCGEWADLLEASQETGSSVPMNFNCLSRDGCFDGEQIFAVFEPADVEQLIDRLQRALKEQTLPARDTPTR